MLTIYRAGGGGGVGTYFIDDVTVKEVTRDNVPRIDYTGGGCPHILAEPQRTNLILIVRILIPGLHKICNCSSKIQVKQHLHQVIILQVKLRINSVSHARRLYEIVLQQSSGSDYTLLYMQKKEQQII